MPNPNRARAIALLAGMALLLPAGAHAADPVTIELAQQPPDLSFHDVTGGEWSPGDFFTFRADVTAADGAAVQLVGDHHTVAMPTDGPIAEQRVGTAVLDFGNGDAIVFAGATPVTRAKEMIDPGTTLVRAVIGGTGRFAGARGEIRSVRATDGSWQHALTFRPADGTPSEAIQLEIATPVTAATRIVGGAGVQRGDIATWTGTGTTADGEAATIYAVQQVTLAPGEQGDAAEAVGYGYTVFSGGDTIVTVGVTTLDMTDGRAALASLHAERAVVGGTGRYAGAQGVQHVMRGDDGALTLVTELYPAPADAPERTLVLRAVTAPMAVLDLGDGGDSMGDRRVWVLPFAADDGTAGVARGYATTIAMPGDDAPTREVAGAIVLAFDDGSTILVADLRAEDPSAPIRMDDAGARAVIGGTGAYAGVSGEMVTTLDADGGLVSTLTLRG